jgi:hypothetical protein
MVVSLKFSIGASTFFCRVRRIALGLGGERAFRWSDLSAHKVQGVEGLILDINLPFSLGFGVEYLGIETPNDPTVSPNLKNCPEFLKKYFVDPQSSEA